MTNALRRYWLAWALAAGVASASCSSGSDHDASTSSGPEGDPDASGTSGGSGNTTSVGTTSGAFDAGSLFPPNAGPAACPTLAAASCWQRLVQEYEMIESCFTHRSLCDQSGFSGDSSECGVWTDDSGTICKWSDGTEVDRDPTTATDVFKSTSGVECYRKRFTSSNGENQLVVTFGSRAYTVTSHGADGTWTISCPDGTEVSTSDTEFQACNFRGVCCSFPEQSCASNIPP
jgi:hypothetical protein